jgi:predicted enzyme related to lactoylglutathione lyase
MTDNVAPIGGFEIAGSDPAKTEAFYSSLFNWTFSDGPSGPDYRMADTGTPLFGGVTKAPPGAPTTYAIFSVIVPDVAATCDQLTELGGTVLVGPQAVGDTGLVFANVQDLDGNHFALLCPPAR